MTRRTPSLRGYRALSTGLLVFAAGMLVGHSGAQPVAVPVVQSAPAPGQTAVTPLPSDAPVANLITLRSMAPGDQSRFLRRMTDLQLVALQVVAVTTPNVLSQANDEALSRGLPELQAGGRDASGAVRAVPVDPMPGVQPLPPSPDLDDLPSPGGPAPQAVDPCEDLDCRIVSV